MSIQTIHDALANIQQPKRTVIYAVVGDWNEPPFTIETADEDQIIVGLDQLLERVDKGTDHDALTGIPVIKCTQFAAKLMIIMAQAFTAIEGNND